MLHVHLLCSDTASEGYQVQGFRRLPGAVCAFLLNDPCKSTRAMFAPKISDTKTDLVRVKHLYLYINFLWREFDD